MSEVVNFPAMQQFQAHRSAPSPQITPELARTYIDAYENSVEIAENYDGKESTYESLMGNLITLEKCLCQICGIPDNQHVSSTEEIMIGEVILRSYPMTINYILDTARKAMILGIAEDASAKEIASALGIFHREVESSFAPPDAMRHYSRGEKSDDETREVGWLPRIQSLITDLHKRGVYTDDLIFKSSPTTGSPWRYPEYALIEIPRLNYMQIFVSNQVGEGTRVSKTPLHVTTYQNMSKRELDRVVGIATVICNSIPQWQAKINALTGYPTQKIPVALVEATRDEISARYTAAEFMALPLDQAEYEGVGDSFLGVVAQALLPGVSVFSNRTRHRLAEIIYGAENQELLVKPEILSVDLDYLTYDGDWRARVQQICADRAEFEKASSQGGLSAIGHQILSTLYQCGLHRDVMETEGSRKWIANQVYGYTDGSEGKFAPKTTIGGDITQLGSLLRLFERDIDWGLASPRRFNSIVTEFENFITVARAASQAVDSFLEENEIDLNYQFDPTIALPKGSLFLASIQRAAGNLRYWLPQYSEDSKATTVVRSSYIDLKSGLEYLKEFEAQLAEAKVRAKQWMLEYAETHNLSALVFRDSFYISPDWNLDLDEEHLFRLLVNERAFFPDMSLKFLASIFDPTSPDLDSIWRGPVGKIVVSLRAKLEDSSDIRLLKVGKDAVTLAHISEVTFATKWHKGLFDIFSG